jgi:hypothetical protein
MRRVLLLLVGLIALATPVEASAKEGVKAVTVCGTGGCVVADDVHVGGLGAPIAPELHSLAPPPPGAYYEVKFSFGRRMPDGPAAFYVRERDLFATRTETAWTTWIGASTALSRLVERLSARVAPFPRPKLTGVWVGARRVSSDPNSYLRLFTLGGSTMGSPQLGHRRSIWFTADRPNPWTNTRIAYYPEDGILEVAAGRFVRLPDGIASNLAAARPLADHGSSGRAWPVPATIGGAAALAVLAFVAAFLLRRRPGRSAQLGLGRGGLSGRSAG